MEKQPNLKIRDFYAKKRMDMYIPKPEPVKNWLDCGEGFVSILGVQYNYPPSRIIDLRP